MAKDEKLKKSKNIKESKNGFLKDSKSELKKVIWPTPKSLVNDTATVIGIVLIVAILVVILDVIFFNLNENVIIKAEEKVKGNNSAVVTEIDQNTIQNTDNTSGETTVDTTGAVTADTAVSTDNVETQGTQETPTAE